MIKTLRLIPPQAIFGLVLLVTGCSSEVRDTSKKSESTKVKPLRAFNTQRIEPSRVTSHINITGRVIPLQKIEVVSEVQGIARNTPVAFKAGVDFNAGDILIAIEDEEFRNNLTAQKSQFLSSLVKIMSDLKLDFPDHFDQWSTYLASVSLEKPLPPLPETDLAQLRYYLSANNVFSTYYNIKSAESTLNKYTIRAPFKGSVVESLIDEGGLIRPNTKLGEYIRTDQYELLASVSVTDIQYIRKNAQILFTSPDTDGEWSAKVSRVGKRVDASTQAVAVYLTVKGKDLKEGMYLEGVINTEVFENAVEISKELLTRNNQVYLIEDSTVQLKEVEPLAFNASSVIVAGLAPGDQLITDPIQSPIQGIAAVSK